MNTKSEAVFPAPRSLDIRCALREAIVQLERSQVPSAPLAAELLLMHALDHDRTWLYAHSEHALDNLQREDYFSLIAKRVSGVPTQYLTGHQEFWGLEFEVTPDVLIPRPETEHVIEVALETIAAFRESGSRSPDTSFRIADVGTGSGCLAIALAHELPSAHIIATDISAPALAIARRNAVRHSVESRIEFLQCNLMDGFTPDGRIAEPCFDLIVSNPPYIGRNEAAMLAVEVAKHEPESALYGGETGTELYEPLIQQTAKLLRPGGALVLELGHNSADHVLQLLGTPGWRRVSITNDLAGIRRVASALR